MKQIMTAFCGACLVIGMGATAAQAEDSPSPVAGPAYTLPKQPDDLNKYYSPGFDKCLKAAHGSRDSELCSLGERDVQLQKLDNIYKRRLAHASHAERIRLEADQAAWQEASNADCRTHNRPGRWGAIAFVSCHCANAISRRLQLEGRPAE